MGDVPLYDAFDDYDRFVNWRDRLRFELPSFLKLFQEHGVKSVLDAAAGTGQHAIAFARQGYRAMASDASKTMVALARENVRAAGVDVAVQQLPFGSLQNHIAERFDAVTCLGNSLPHVLTDGDMHKTLEDFAAVLNPGGLVLIQNRNLERVLATHERYMSPQESRAKGYEYIFWRFYDFEAPLLRFNMVRLKRFEGGPWDVCVDSTMLRVWRYAEWEQLLHQSGLHLLGAYGSYGEEPFDVTTSGDLILVAAKVPATA